MCILDSQAEHPTLSITQIVTTLSAISIGMIAGITSLIAANQFVRRGGFDLRLNLLAGVGSYQSASLHYRFRCRDGCFRLTGYDRLETHRATLNTKDLKIDFLTGTVVRTTGNAKSGVEQVRRERLPDRRRRCFQDLGSAADYEPL